MIYFYVKLFHNFLMLFSTNIFCSLFTWNFSRNFLMLFSTNLFYSLFTWNFSTTFWCYFQRWFMFVSSNLAIKFWNCYKQQILQLINPLTSNDGYIPYGNLTFLRPWIPKRSTDPERRDPCFLVQIVIWHR